MLRPELVALESREWEDEAPGVRARAARADGRRWAIVEYAGGASRDEWCDDGHRGFVLAGEIEYEFGDGHPPIAAREGQGFVLPAGQAHRGRNPGARATRLFLIDDPA